MRLAGTLILWILSLAVLLASVAIGVVAAQKAPYAPALYAAVAAGVLFALFLNPRFASLTRLRARPGVRWSLVGAAFLAGIVGTGISFDQLFLAPTRIFNQAVTMMEKHPGDRATAEQAAPLYQRACDARVYEACHNLAVLHDLNGPLPHDPAMAGLLYDKACAHDVALSCVNRGRQYYAGDGIKSDAARARIFYMKGCDAKVLIGCNGALAVDMADYVNRKAGAKARVLADYTRVCELSSKDGKAACKPEDFTDLFADDEPADNAAAASDDSMAIDAPAVDDVPAASETPAPTHAQAPARRTASPPTPMHHRPPPRPSATPSQPGAWTIS
ncbi:hypothetical protein [Sphingomonas sp. KR3-1]|uniref:tetratricopeptide repeat protein n=1 Tax=Sphingomonas sp. KR3-1 TaxID=3156611 RepID=UPI0032B35FE5